MAKSLRERYIAALEKRGCKQVPSRSGKYVTLTSIKQLDDGIKRFYFIGRSGAVRYGRSASHSIPISDRIKERLLQEDRA